MKLSAERWVVLFLAFSWVHLANACPGAVVELNNSSWLRADGIYGSKGLEHSVDEMEDRIKSGKRAAYTEYDKDGKRTHNVEYIGSIRDSGGIIQGVYVVGTFSNDTERFPSGVENTVILKSNYVGNGMMAKDLSAPDSELQPVLGLKQVLGAGCN